MECSSKIEKVLRIDAHAGFEGNHRLAGYGKQCLLVSSCVEKRGWSNLMKGIII